MMDFRKTARSVLPRRTVLGIGLLAFLVVVSGCDSEDLGDANPQTPSVGDYVSQVSALSTLNEAVHDAGLSEALGNDGITLFASVNGAFDPAIDPTLNRAVMRDVIQHHVVSGEVSTESLSDNETVSPLVGAPLSIGVGDDVTVNRTTVTNGDASAANGVVHVIDGLLVDAVDRAALTPQFTLFARLVGEAGLDTVLREAGASDGRTIFAPTNEALLRLLDANDSGQLESSEIPSNVGQILRGHVHDEVFSASNFLSPPEDVEPDSYFPVQTTLSTLERTDLTIRGLRRRNGDREPGFRKCDGYDSGG